MSLLNFLRHIFGSPIEYRVMKLEKNAQYLFRIDSDDKNVIKEFMKQIKKARKSGEDIFIPINVEVERKKHDRR